MTEHSNVRPFIGEDEVKSFEDALKALELSLATVQKVIERSADGRPAKDPHNGVHLGLYVLHTQAVLILCRELLAANDEANP